MTTKEVSPAVREMAEKLRREWIAEGGAPKYSAYVSGYLRARADVEAEIERIESSYPYGSAGAASARDILRQLRNPPAPLHPAIENVCAQLRRGPLPLDFANHAAADALEAAARKEGWVSK